MKWRLAYCKRRIKQIIGDKKWALDGYDELVKESNCCKNTWFNRFDFLCCYLLFGIEAEDYFSFGFYEHRNPFFRNHHVSRTRLNFIKSRFNTEEGVKLFTNKSEFNRIYDEYLGRNWCCPNETDEETFVNKLSSEGKKVFVKLLDGFGGKGAFATSADAVNLRNLYKELTQGDAKYIVEEFVSQKGFLRGVNPSSVNTLRITTVRVGKDAIPMHAYYRAGGMGSPVDNLHSGGVMYTIDIRTGELQKGVDYTRKDIETHPSTGVRVAGYIIPDWNKVLEYTKKLHAMAPKEVNLVGWDICISENKYSLIEGNAGPGFPQELKYSDNTWKKIRKAMSKMQAI